jgi:TetR/AcrR family transcriptional regulator
MPVSGHLPDKKERVAKASILEAAVAVFGRHGLEGARTQAIADQAGVNIALLFYYFEDKERLYQSVLESVLAAWAARLHAALDPPGSPAERLQRYAEAAFDFIAEDPARARLVQLEIIQDLRGRRFAAPVKKYVQPVRQKLRELLRAGMESRIFWDADPDDLATSIHGVLMAHFNSSTVIRILTGQDPFSSVQIRRRRQAVLEFIRRAVLAGASS